VIFVDRLAKFMKYRHPTARLLAWALCGTTVLLTQASNHVVQFTVIVMFSLFMLRHHVVQIVWRARYVFLASAVSFVCLTPGERIAALPWASVEGAEAALRHDAHLLLMLIVVAWLAALLESTQLIIAVIGLQRLLGQHRAEAGPWLRRMMLTLRLMTQAKQQRRGGTSAGIERNHTSSWANTDEDAGGLLYVPRWEGTDVWFLAAFGLMCALWLGTFGVGI
jgi:hypothetical protein